MRLGVGLLHFFETRCVQKIVSESHAGILYISGMHHDATAVALLTSTPLRACLSSSQVFLLKCCPKANNIY